MNPLALVAIILTASKAWSGSREIRDSFCSFLLISHQNCDNLSGNLLNGHHNRLVLRCACQTPRLGQDLRPNVTLFLALRKLWETNEHV